MTTLAIAIRGMGGALGRIDRVILAIVALFAGLAMIVPAQAVASLVFTLEALGFISPFFIASVLVAAGARATGLDRQIAVVFGGRQAVVILFAALFGALSPFCSCGVVPIIAALLTAGVPLAPVMAFLISSPIMDPEMFILTAAVFGLPFAVAKTLAAVAMGLFAGYVTHAVAGRIPNPMRAGIGGCGSCGGPTLSESSAIVWTFWRHDDRRAVFGAEARATGWFLFKWLALAFALESLMVAYLPAGMVASMVGADHWWAIPASVLIGIPAYLNGYAAIPTVSGLVDLGMAPGAALAFMVAGAVTSIPAAMAVFALVRRPVFALYLVFGLAGSLAAGLSYQAFAAL